MGPSLRSQSSSRTYAAVQPTVRASIFNVGWG